MTIESWNPASEADNSSYKIENALLLRFIEISKQENWQELTTLLTSEEIDTHRQIMKQNKDAWFAATENLDEEQIVNLVKFFTEAEMQINGWEAGAESPVIWLVKVLRRRKCAPNKDLLLWIKTHSTNRFIPNGAL